MKITLIFHNRGDFFTVYIMCTTVTFALDLVVFFKLCIWNVEMIHK